MTSGLFSSIRDDWETPRALFDHLNKRFCFEVDVAANSKNHLCSIYFSQENPLTIEKAIAYNRFYCNPPYGRAIGGFVELIATLCRDYGKSAVMLLPARTDTKWFHSFIYKKPNTDIDFIKGRLKFTICGKAQKNAPFPSMIVYFNCRGIEK